MGWGWGWLDLGVAGLGVTRSRCVQAVKFHGSQNGGKGWRLRYWLRLGICLDLWWCDGGLSGGLDGAAVGQGPMRFCGEDWFDMGLWLLFFVSSSLSDCGSGFGTVWGSVGCLIFTVELGFL